MEQPAQSRQRPRSGGIKIVRVQRRELFRRWKRSSVSETAAGATDQVERVGANLLRIKNRRRIGGSTKRTGPQGGPRGQFQILNIAINAAAEYSTVPHLNFTLNLGGKS
jgi:hypothetical protein